MLVFCEPETKMGWLFGAVVAVIAAPVAAIRGGMDAIQGCGFQMEAENTLEKAFELGAEFGDEHGAKVLIRVVSGIVLQGLFDLPIDFTDHDT